MRRLLATICQRFLDFFGSIAWLAPLLVRVFFGYFWLETGWAKLHNLDGAIARFVDWGIPNAAFNATLSAGTEFVGGCLLVIGLFTRFTSAVMAFNMIVAIVLVAGKNVHTFDDFVELDEFVDILLFVWLLIAGPGKISVDTLISRWLGLTHKRMD
jgi:putative oxidoreductase